LDYFLNLANFSNFFGWSMLITSLNYDNMNSTFDIWRHLCHAPWYFQSPNLVVRILFYHVLDHLYVVSDNNHLKTTSRQNCVMSIIFMVLSRTSPTLEFEFLNVRDMSENTTKIVFLTLTKSSIRGTIQRTKFIKSIFLTIQWTKSMFKIKMFKASSQICITHDFIVQLTS
jgi:hypothetical protein